MNTKLVHPKLHVGLPALLILIAFTLQACPVPESRNPNEPNTDRLVKNRIERANQLAGTKSEIEIENYLARTTNPDTLTLDPYGFHYAIWGTPQGPAPREGQTVTATYNATLLNGKNVIEEHEPVSITIGKREQPAGLEILLMRMKTGQSAWAILPAHLAYGFQGLQDRIPPNACLIYTVTLHGILDPTVQ